MSTPAKNHKSSAEQKLKELGIQLPSPPEPFGPYSEAVQTGALLFLSGMLFTVGRSATFTGRVGAELDGNEGSKAARLAVIAVEAQMDPGVAQSVHGLAAHNEVVVPGVDPTMVEGLPAVDRQVWPYSLLAHRAIVIVTAVVTHVADAPRAGCEVQHV